MNFASESKNLYTNLNNDELYMIAIRLDLPDLINFNVLNRQTLKLCLTDRIWNYKLQNDFSEYIDDFRCASKRDQYKLLYELKKLNIGLKLNKNLKELYNSKELFIMSTNMNIIPGEIKHLQNLQKLHLDENEIGTIPWELGQLQNLQSIYLSYNQIRTIPGEIG